MALNQNVFEASVLDCKTRPSGLRPIDLVHLAKQTSGDRNLERDILSLFGQQVRQTLLKLSNCDSKQRVVLARDIRGIAANVGAFDVEKCASNVELNPDDAVNLTAFTSAAIKVDAFIAALDRV